METEAFFKKTEVKFWKKLKTEPKNSECRRIDPTDASKKWSKKEPEVYQLLLKIHSHKGIGVHKSQIGSFQIIGIFSGKEQAWGITLRLLLAEIPPGHRTGWLVMNKTIQDNLQKIIILKSGIIHS